MSGEKQLKTMALPERWKNYAQQRETTGSINDFLHLCPFFKWELLKRKEFAPRGSEFFLLRAVPYGKENNFYHIR